MVPKCKQFRYLGLLVQENEMIDKDNTHRIKIEWLKRKSTTGVLYHRMKLTKVKSKFYRITMRLTMLYGRECWVVKPNVSTRRALQRNE